MARRAAGAILRGWLVMLGLAVAIAGLCVVLAALQGGQREQVVVYCAAGIKPPMEAVVEEYRKACGVSVQLQYGGSGTLLANLQVARSGDLFIAADESYVRVAREKGVVAEMIPLAMQRPVIVVKRGNPKKIVGLADLRRADVKTALANPEAASIGRTVKEQLTAKGEWADLAKRVTVFKPTVNDVANDVKLGTVDAGIVWDANVKQYAELEAVHDPLLDEISERVTIGVLKYTESPARALKFARYLAASDGGQRVFAKLGYTPVDGEVWEEHK